MSHAARTGRTLPVFPSFPNSRLGTFRLRNSVSSQGLDAKQSFADRRSQTGVWERGKFMSPFHYDGTNAAGLESNRRHPRYSGDGDARQAQPAGKATCRVGNSKIKMAVSPDNRVP